MTAMPGQFVVQPTPLSAVWTQTYPDLRRTHFAAVVYGWVTSHLSVTPAPVVLHPRVGRLASLGLDTIGGLSDLALFQGDSGWEAACFLQEQRRADDEAARAAASCGRGPCALPADHEGLCGA